MIKEVKVKAPTKSTFIYEFEKYKKKYRLIGYRYFDLEGYGYLWLAER